MTYLHRCVIVLVQKGDDKMSITFDSNIPIYLQVQENIEMTIITGIKKPGEKLDSVRDLALYYGVNPNTIQRALNELERSGLIYTQRAVGKYVTLDEKLIIEFKKRISIEKVKEFISRMVELGNEKEEIIQLIQQEMGE